MEIKKIETILDLPEYGKDVLVWGVNKKMYDIPKWHVCHLDDLESGFDFAEKGKFHWLTENGTLIEEVTHWCELPLFKDMNWEDIPGIQRAYEIIRSEIEWDYADAKSREKIKGLMEKHLPEY